MTAAGRPPEDITLYTHWRVFPTLSFTDKHSLPRWHFELQPKCKSAKEGICYHGTLVALFTSRVEGLGPLSPHFRLHIGIYHTYIHKLVHWCKGAIYIYVAHPPELLSRCPLETTEKKHFLEMHAFQLTYFRCLIEGKTNWALQTIFISIDYMDSLNNKLR